MNKTILVSAAILGGLTVIIGAFGAHGLKKLVDVESLNTFETGVRYQMYHALLLLFVGSTSYLSQNTKMTLFYLIVAGIILFSGSIYGLATNELTSFDFKKIGFVTPIGGALLIVAWGIMVFKFISLKS